MANNQYFIELTNFLKNRKNINFTKQVDILGVERHRFDSWRADRVEVPDFAIADLMSHFKEYETEITESLSAKAE